MPSERDGTAGPILNPGVLFLVAIPGLEDALEAEAHAAGFASVVRLAGGVEVAGGLSEAKRANMVLRTAVRVLWRVAAFRAMHLAQLDKRSRKVPWSDWMAPGTKLRVEATCRASRIYHDKAARQRVERALTDAGMTLDAGAEIAVKVRIEDDLCTVSIDTSGEPLHRRGHKAYVGKAPLRETMAAAFLWRLGFDGTQAVVDPMCGSGTIPIEAAEIAAGLAPGRSRSFAFEGLVDGTRPALPPRGADIAEPRFHGFDRDQGAVSGATGNAERAGVGRCCRFVCQPVSDLTPPEGPPGIVLTNPPYGARIGNRKLLFGLYGSLGKVLSERFVGWTIGLVTSDDGLARATGLGLEPSGHVDHSGTKIRLWQGRIGG